MKPRQTLLVSKLVL